MNTKFYVVILGGMASIKEFSFEQWERHLAMYDRIQDVKRFAEVESDSDGLPRMEIYVCGADMQILFIRKVWER